MIEKNNSFGQPQNTCGGEGTGLYPPPEWDEGVPSALGKGRQGGVAVESVHVGGVADDVHVGVHPVLRDQQRLGADVVVEEVGGQAVARGGGRLYNTMQ